MSNLKMERIRSSSWSHDALSPSHPADDALSSPYQQDDDDADVLGIFPEFVSWNHFGVVNESSGEDEQTEKLQQHRHLETKTHSDVTEQNKLFGF